MTDEIREIAETALQQYHRDNDPRGPWSIESIERSASNYVKEGETRYRVIYRYEKMLPGFTFALLVFKRWPEFPWQVSWFGPTFKDGVELRDDRAIPAPVNGTVPPNSRLQEHGSILPAHCAPDPDGT